MSNYVLNDEKMFCDIADGIAIVINSETGIYYGLNGFGTAVFENILNGASTEAVLAAVKAMPGAPADSETRLGNFVAALIKHEIVLQGPSGEGAVNLDPAIAEADSFALEVKEYSDAQELLLADPIHEVRTDTGWKPEKDALETDEEALKAKREKAEK